MTAFMVNREQNFPHEFTRVISIAAIAAIIMSLIILKLVTRPVAPVIAHPIENMSTTTQPAFALSDKFVYRQDDAAWAMDRIGRTTDTMQSFGCTISGVSMAISNLLDEEISPGELNKRLSENNGFTNRGWLIWNKIPDVTENRIDVVYNISPSHDNIRQCMDDGGYPILKIKLYDQIIHWVTVVGMNEREYLIRDPLVGTPQDPPIELSGRSNFIYATRCISKTIE